MGEEEEEEELVGMKNKKPSSVSLDLNKASTLISDHLHNPSSSISPKHPPSEDPLAQEPKSNPEQEPKEIKSPTNEEPPLFLNPNPNIPGSDLEKKFRRAERFGMPVQLSEEEKRTSRAERFGSKSITRGSEVMKKSEEEQKRKARAERFGLPANSVVDEESKKKARLARFAPVGKLDSAEEDKKKVRALRFSQTSTSSPSSQENGKAKTELIPT